MRYWVQYPFALVSACLWLGFIGAISFMEAWLKFQAPGITVPLGLGIGRIVFAALNLMEWIFAIIILLHYFRLSHPIIGYWDLSYFIPVVLLIIQTFFWLPALDARAEQHIQGAVMPPSTLHFYYIAAEVGKAIALIIFITTRFYSKQRKVGEGN
jgi:hypothetical protein